MKIQIDLPISAEILLNRKCDRCESIDFREVVTEPFQYVARCADCIYHGNYHTCGKIISYVITSDVKEKITRCGDMVNGVTCSKESPITRPMAICMDCHKLVDLQ